MDTATSENPAGFPKAESDDRDYVSRRAGQRAVGKHRADDCVVASALRILETRARTPGPQFCSTAVATTWFHLRLSELPQEVMAVAWLDARLRLIEFRELFRGTVSGTVVHMREVARSALACNAVQGIFAHNHPSGDATPSDADIAVTRELRAALALVEVGLLDHIVVAPGAEPVSMASLGLLADVAPRKLTRQGRRRHTAG